MEKVLIEVYVPALDTSYDIFIPIQVPMYKVLQMIKKMIIELSSGKFRADDETLICNRVDGTIVNINLSAFELNIQNGSRLMLI